MARKQKPTHHLHIVAYYAARELKGFFEAVNEFSKSQQEPKP